MRPHKYTRIVDFSPVAWPAVVVADSILNHRTNRCKKCKLRLRDCKCEKPEPNAMEEFTGKASLRLDLMHPDHPAHPRRLCLRAVPHSVRLTLDIYI